MKTNSLKQYIDELNKQYKTGIAREHSYRPALKDLLQSLLPKMVVTNEPAHFECGAPDYISWRICLTRQAYHFHRQDPCKWTAIVGSRIASISIASNISRVFQNPPGISTLAAISLPRSGSKTARA